MQLILLGSSYRNTSLAIREKFALSENQSVHFLKEAINNQHIHECVFISTCNRTEVYAITENLEAARAYLIQLLCDYTQLTVETIEDSIATFYNKFAAEHLYRVAAGLDSMVIGEHQILGQVKQALKQAQDLKTSGTILNQLFQIVIQTGKRVRCETDISKKPASIGSVATGLITQHFDSSARPNVLLIGTGKIGAVTIKNLQRSNIGRLVIANRSPEKLQALSEQVVADHFIGLNELSDYIPQMDVVIVCTSASNYVLDESFSTVFKASSRKRLLIDLSVPRNIAPELGQLEHITLYDVDALRSQAEENQQERVKYIPQAEKIIFEGMTQYVEWFNSLNTVPTIESLYRLLDEIRQREIQRALPKMAEELDAQEATFSELEVVQLLEKVTRSITQKILHYPVMSLRMEPNPKAKQNYVDVLSSLFRLDSEDYIDRYLYRQKSKTAKLSQA